MCLVRLMLMEVNSILLSGSSSDSYRFGIDYDMCNISLIKNVLS
jgi:hypothetical protein